MTTQEEKLLYWREYHRKRRLDPLQRELDNKKQQARRKANPEKAKEASRKSEQRRRLSKYGLTIDQYTKLLKSQGDRCAICEVPLLDNRLTHVDHCHATGKVRGILCRHCNLLLGNAKDSLVILSAAYSYLENNID